LTAPVAGRDPRLVSTRADAVADSAGVVAAVSEYQPTLAVDTATGRVDERQQLAIVVDVRGRDRDRERHSSPVDDQVPLTGLAAAIHRASPSLRAPFFAGAILESTSSRASSNPPARSNSNRNETSSRPHTPDRCHSSSRRQHLTPDTPNWAGTARHGNPENNTHKIPSKHRRSSTRNLPG
jgi:hypothetical protein